MSAAWGRLQELPDTGGDQALRLKYGFTCGECLEGFISPRMKLTLLVHLEITFDMLNEYIDEGSWCDENDYLTLHAAPATRQNFRTNKSLRKGWQCSRRRRCQSVGMDEYHYVVRNDSVHT